MTLGRIALAGAAALILARALMAGVLPLSADEAYYWLWSKNLAAGYFDHPPAVAWLIRAGTTLFADTSFGVRAATLPLSIAASWFVWATAHELLKDDSRAALACLFFNLTLMASVEMLAATPDMPSITTSASFFYFLSRLQRSGDGRWWIAVGLSAGLGLLSKYSAFFLGAGTLIWLVLDRHARSWLFSPWPYLGAAVALGIFAPNLVWQSHNHWQTFAFQFGRIGTGHFTLRFIAEFFLAQLGLATPLIFLLMIIGLWRASRIESESFLLAVMVWTATVYFTEHALHDRVQGNWPCFLYPALSVLAAKAYSTHGKWHLLSRAAAPLAGLMLLLIYGQAQFQVLALRKDPIARILGRDFHPVGDAVAAKVRAQLADAILTSDYETTALLRFYHPQLKVIQINDSRRYPGAPSADSGLLHRRLLYVSDSKRDAHLLLHRFFNFVGFPTQLRTPAGLYCLYPVNGPKTSTLGKMP